MQRVKLYGKGAAVFHYGKDVIRAENGVLEIPALLVPQALAMGFTTQPTGPDGTTNPFGTLAEVTKKSEPVAALSAPSVADRVALYEQEARDAGYTADAVAGIVQERLRYDELIASGMSEDDAVASVWGPKDGDAADATKAMIRAALEAKDATVVDARIAPVVKVAPVTEEPE